MNKKLDEHQNQPHCSLKSFIDIKKEREHRFKYKNISKVKSVANIIKAIPIFKQSSLVGYNFCLIHAVQVNDEQLLSLAGAFKNENYIYVLLSLDKVDINRYFDQTTSFVRSKILMNIYPPWYFNEHFLQWRI